MRMWGAHQKFFRVRFLTKAVSMTMTWYDGRGGGHRRRPCMNVTRLLQCGLKSCTEHEIWSELKSRTESERERERESLRGMLHKWKWGLENKRNKTIMKTSSQGSREFAGLLPRLLFLCSMQAWVMNVTALRWKIWCAYALCTHMFVYHIDPSMDVDGGGGWLQAALPASSLHMSWELHAGATLAFT